MVNFCQCKFSDKLSHFLPSDFIKKTSETRIIEAMIRLLIHVASDIDWISLIFKIASNKLLLLLFSLNCKWAYLTDNVMTSLSEQGCGAISHQAGKLILLRPSSDTLDTTLAASSLWILTAQCSVTMLTGGSPGTTLLANDLCMDSINSCSPGTISSFYNLGHWAHVVYMKLSCLRLDISATAAVGSDISIIIRPTQLQVMTSIWHV